jgi:hypothetical protein
MNDPNKYYRLVFTGELRPGFSKKKVVSQLQSALHLDKKNAERLVEGKHRQIDKKLTLDRAEKLRLYILERGAECVLLPIEDSFIDTQQLPEFVRDDDDTNSNINNTESDPEVSKKSNDPPSADNAVLQGASPGIYSESSIAGTNAKQKYLLLGVLFLIVGAIVIWMMRPALDQNDSSTIQQANSNLERAKQNPSVTGLPVPAKVEMTEETETDGKLKNLTVRTGLWFADQGGKIDPTEVTWIWIQGDLGVSVREMNDSWGKPIKYIGKSDGFEMRSSGPDKIFYTDDDIFRNTNIN